MQGNQAAQPAMVETVDHKGQRILRPETAAEQQERLHWATREKAINRLVDDRYCARRLRERHFEGGPLRLNALAEMIGSDLATAFELAAADLPSELSACGDLETRLRLAPGTLTELLRPAD